VAFDFERHESCQQEIEILPYESYESNESIFEALNLQDFLINTVYKSSEGEGIHLGIPQIFIRFQGCLIGCVNCDSKETWDFKSKSPITLQNILNELDTINKPLLYPIKRISITGGDPLHPLHEKPLRRLVKALKGSGYFVNIEASGSRAVEDIFQSVDFVSFDIKTPSTEVRTPITVINQLFKILPPEKFQLKSVVASTEDFDYVCERYEKLLSLYGEEVMSKVSWCITPAQTPPKFNMDNFELVLRMNENIGGKFRVIGQQHKWVYGFRENV
jgi:7-carboxy-7-deazaguanine synthase